MKRFFIDDFYKCIAVIVFVLALAVSNLFAQRASRIFDNCPNTTAKAEVKLLKGNVVITPCPTKTLIYNGSPFSPTGLTTLNGIAGATQTFASGVNDTTGIVSAGTAHTFNFPISAISGASRTGFLPIFDGQNTLAKSLISQTGNNVSVNLNGGIFKAGLDNLLSLSLNTGSAIGTMTFGDFIFTTTNGGNVVFDSGVQFLDKIKVNASCSGQSTIVTNNLSVTTSCVTGSTSKIFLTPTVAGEPLYISAKSNGSFTAACSDGACSAVTFDWFIINVL